MNELHLSERIAALKQLAQKETIFFDDVPEKFRPDLHNFIVGRTLTMQEGKIVIGHNLYKWWLRKLNTKGFDYEIEWEQ